MTLYAPSRTVLGRLQRGLGRGASYLEAYLKVDREDAEPGLREGLWDCERDVRLLAVQMVGLDRHSRDRVAYLRDDPMEDPGVRGAAVARLIA